VVNQPTRSSGRGVAWIVVGALVGVFALFRLSIILVTRAPSVSYLIGEIVAVLVLAAIAVALIAIGFRRRTR
jgi:hypothetical protein